MSDAVPYQGTWTCSECGDTSASEHDPCSCDDTCTEHVEEIASLRRQLDAVVRERDEAKQAAWACEGERDEARKQLDDAQHALANERQANAVDINELLKESDWRRAVDARLEKLGADLTLAEARLGDRANTVHSLVLRVRAAEGDAHDLRMLLRDVLVRVTALEGLPARVDAPAAPPHASPLARLQALPALEVGGPAGVVARRVQEVVEIVIEMAKGGGR